MSAGTGSLGESLGCQGGLYHVVLSLCGLKEPIVGILLGASRRGMLRRQQPLYLWTPCARQTRTQYFFHYHLSLPEELQLMSEKAPWAFAKSCSAFRVELRFSGSQYL